MNFFKLQQSRRPEPTVRNSEDSYFRAQFHASTEPSAGADGEVGVDEFAPLRRKRFNGAVGRSRR